jgi:pimeloyl-ACP methyl ester carboxylesterase
MGRAYAGAVRHPPTATIPTGWSTASESSSSPPTMTMKPLILETRDVVVIDQRGTGYSQPSPFCRGGTVGGGGDASYWDDDLPEQRWRLSPIAATS